MKMLCILTVVLLASCADPNSYPACSRYYECSAGHPPDGSGDCDGFEDGSFTPDCNACLAQAPCEVVAGTSARTGKELVGCDAQCK